MRLKESFKANRDIASITGFFVVMQFTNWPPLLFWGWWGGGNFLDSWQVLAASDCYQQIGLDVYKIQNPCMLYAYGRPLLWVLSFFHLGASQSSLFGFAFLVLISIVLSKLLRVITLANGQRILIAALVVASPPILLLVDRGNFDSLIVAFVILAAWLHGRDRDALAVLTLFTATLFKYYTMPLLFLMVFLAPKRRIKALSIFLAVISILSIIRDLKITEFVFSGKNPHLTFGIGHEFLYLLEYNNFRWLEDFYKVGGATLVAIACALFCFQLRKVPIYFDLFNDNKEVKSLYLFTTTIFICCYLSGTNADYRLIFLVISSFYLTSLLPENSPYKLAVIYATIVALWLTYPSGDLEIFGDALLTLICGFQIVLTSRLILRRNNTN